CLPSPRYPHPPAAPLRSSRPRLPRRPSSRPSRARPPPHGTVFHRRETQRTCDCSSKPAGGCSRPLRFQVPSEPAAVPAPGGTPPAPVGPVTKEAEFYRFAAAGSTRPPVPKAPRASMAWVPAAARPGDAVGRQWATIQALSSAMQVAERAAASLSFEDVARLAGPEMAAVDDLIRESLKSDVMLVSQVSEYIVTSGGKRLRPLIVLLAARALGYGGRQHLLAAAIIEFIHTATLLHDDVVDSSARRRGRDTANTVFGN